MSPSSLSLSLELFKCPKYPCHGVYSSERLNSDDMFLSLNEKSSPSIFTKRKLAVCLNGFLLPRTSSTQLLISAAFIKAIKMHKSRISIYHCPSSSLLLDMLHNCLLVRFISNPPCDVFAGPGCFHNSMPSEHIHPLPPSLSLSLTELAAVLVL